ncbi:sensor domain-containing protein [Cryobacterium sp. PH31-AA6]|uniref:sensor histidine kinase n=1 Tax=Cryobacterium sp. PH31-AA6 TaxID=3046205 RepID=UPI0024BA24D3|nr:sensor domain-containing protein [Cryobacterium sp. PH31-AA6]MDJ0324474.1 sensor domain-containing protein [Cryobacterium sp. PH31-AA6]
MSETATSTTRDDLMESSTQQPVSRSGGYGALWRRVPRELGFLLPTLPIVVVGLSVLSTVFFTGTGMIAIFVGLFIVVLALYIARGFGLFELTRLRWAGQAPVTRPRWDPVGEPATPLRTVLGPLVNGHYWLYLLHGMIVNFIVGVISWTVTVVWLSIGLGGISYWFWGRFLPTDDTGTVWLYQTLTDWMLPGSTLAIEPFLGESLLQLMLGVVFLATLPLITRGFTALHRFIAWGMLGAWRSEALQREVADLSASRGAAVSAEDQSLRRLERDIHDGPQQRLVRLQMDLASAERKLDTDPAAARGLLVEARAQAHDTLEELRALSRGLVPPILQDRGLIAGLESLAARSTIPVRLELTVDPAMRFPSEIERSAYFAASELLTNAAKHSGASGIRLHLALRRVPDSDTTWLDLWVIDNGVGGAVPTDSHGLRGLDERLRGLRGVLSITSPAGGPTAVGAHIPLTQTVPGSIVLS